MNLLNNPIFLVGCARSGTTLLASYFYSHPQIGNRINGIEKNCEKLVCQIREAEYHLKFSTQLERKRFWYWFYSQQNIFTDMGLELVTSAKARWYKKILGTTYLYFLGRGKRLLIKSPTNSFRICSIKQDFPSVKIVVIFRKGEEVIASWGRRQYGFSKMGYENAIQCFAKKWNETNRYILSCARQIPMHFITYQNLTSYPEREILRAFKYCGLNAHLETKITPQKISDWRDVIPNEYHRMTQDLVAETNNAIELHLKTEPHDI